VKITSAAGSFATGAVDAVQVLDVGRGFGVGGKADIGGGVEAGIIRNDAGTAIASTAQLNAKGDVDVIALSFQGVTSYAVGGAGAVGVAGAVSVWTLGGTFVSSYRTESGSNTDSLAVFRPVHFGSWLCGSPNQPNRCAGSIGVVQVHG
jgi:hypothetical protein